MCLHVGTMHIMLFGFLFVLSKFKVGDMYSRVKISPLKKYDLDHKGRVIMVEYVGNTIGCICDI